LLWNTEKRFVPDAAAISLVTDAAMAGLAGALDLGAALVLVQVGRLHLDGLALRPRGTGGGSCP
jgi:hypothetical protein